MLLESSAQSKVLSLVVEAFGWQLRYAYQTVLLCARDIRVDTIALSLTFPIPHSNQENEIGGWENLLLRSTNSSSAQGPVLFLYFKPWLYSIQRVTSLFCFK